MARRSRSLLVLALLLGVGAAGLAVTALGLGSMTSSADAVADLAPADRTGPSGPLRDGRPAAIAHPPPDGEPTLDEDFDDLDPDLWGRCFWWQPVGCTIASNDEQQRYLPENVGVKDGVLRLEAREDPGTGGEGVELPYSSGMVTTGAPEYEEPARWDFTYGYIEARLRLPAGQGLWPAFWLLPSTQESRPEIDVLEVLGHLPEQAEFHYHYDDEDGERASLGDDVTIPAIADGDWHTYAVDWSPGRITWIVDGIARYEVTGADVSDEPMYLVLNLAVGGEWPGDPDETTPFPAVVEADHIRVWTADEGPP